MTDMNSKDMQRLRAMWCEYARPRFSTHQSQVRWVRLRDEVYAAWTVRAIEAQQLGGRLAFSRNDLLASVIRGLGEACEFCGQYFGVESWGVVRRNPLRKVQGNAIERTDFSIASVAVCCARCSLAHRMFIHDLMDRFRKEMECESGKHSRPDRDECVRMNNQWVLRWSPNTMGFHIVAEPAWRNDDG